MNYKKAIEDIVKRRSTRVADAKVMYLELLKSSPKLYEIEKKIRNIKMDMVLGKKPDEEELKILCARRDAVLAEMGITDDMINPPYECKLCLDTGLINGKPCSCVISKCSQDGITYQNSFSSSDLSIFPKAELSRIERVYAAAKSFCDKFPSTKKLNILLMGRCGSGKTYLASCINNEILSKGYSVIMLSAFALNNRMHKYHTTFDSDRSSYLDPLLDCDLLIIDDLGTETMMKNVTAEYLFHIINERMSEGLHTMITTNLDDEIIKLRYGERLYSRLFGNKLSIGFALSDSDLRK